MASMTMTIRVPVELGDKLSRLAAGTRRSRSFLAGEALEAYVERELAIIEGIRQGMEDAAAGRLIDHEDAMAELEAVVAEVRAARQ